MRLHEILEAVRKERPISPPTPQLMAWFGTSKVANPDGTPMVVYHGTSKIFSRVNMRKGAQGLFWFTSNKAKIEAGEAGASGSGIIMPLYVKIERPAGWAEYDKLMLFQLEREYDGVILPDGDGHFDGFVFNANQVKSADRNNGDYDPNNPYLTK